ncbi:hypothetical protein AA0488_0035 [Kozakia baliensis NRIC 0488]|nr:hypothetical protein AA0488_0035 [Kozakia baliensis NRIC 0488]
MHQLSRSGFLIEGDFCTILSKIVCDIGLIERPDLFDASLETRKIKTADMP